MSRDEVYQAATYSNAEEYIDAFYEARYNMGRRKRWSLAEQQANLDDLLRDIEGWT